MLQDVVELLLTFTIITFNNRRSGLIQTEEQLKQSERLLATDTTHSKECSFLFQEPSHLQKS